MEKIYVGSGKVKETQFGNILKVGFNSEDIQKMTANLNEKGWVNLDISKRKTPSQYGQTHSISIDNWKPDNNGTPVAPPPPPQSSTQRYGVEDIPPPPMASVPRLEVPPAIDQQADNIQF